TSFPRHWSSDVYSSDLITTIVRSPMPRKIWKDKKIIRTDNGYPDWARVVALQSGSAFIDLNTAVANRYDQLGPKKVDALFADKSSEERRGGNVSRARRM